MCYKYEVGSSCGFFKRCCNDNLLKIVQNWTAHHFSRAKQLAMKFSKVIYLYESFGKWAQSV